MTLETGGQAHAVHRRRNLVNDLALVFVMDDEQQETGVERSGDNRRLVRFRVEDISRLQSGEVFVHGCYM